MSLLKQTQIMVTLLLIITLIIVLRISFNTAREFTANQSYVDTKNHANMLALTLNSRPKDEAFMKTSINAMFDGGYFESIVLIRQDGTMVYEKREKVAIHGVPSFFIHYLDLVTPEVEAKVMAGWNIFGTLKIKGHPGSSYKKLWETLKQLCLQFFILGIFVFIISLLGLHHLLGALKKIKHQAEKISKNEFIVNKNIPKIPELRKVVLAMNTMVLKVESIFEHHLESLSRYQKLKYKDKITGLHNRSSFVKQLQVFIEDESEKAQGHVVIIGMTGMEEIEAYGNRDFVHKIFRHMAKIFEKETQTVSNALISRFPRREFAAILPGTDSGAVVKFVETTIRNFLSKIDPDLPDTIRAYGGISSYDKNDEVGIVLSRADYSLSKAKIGLPGSVRIFRDESFQTALGKQKWKTLIETAFSNNRFFLTAQQVLSDGDELHREIFVNMVDQDGIQHQANLFMPMIQALGLASRLDRYILGESAAYLMENPGNILAVNMTSEFCRDRMTGPWLRQFLLERKSMAQNLVFEIHENTLINYPEICIDFIGLITGMGFKFGIDRFTMHDVSLNLLKKLKPYYIKIERDYLEVFDDPKKVDMVLNSLFTIIESLSIKLVAVKIENEMQRFELLDKNIVYFQGHGVAGIIPLKGEK